MNTVVFKDEIENIIKSLKGIFDIILNQFFYFSDSKENNCSL